MNDACAQGTTATEVLRIGEHKVPYHYGYGCVPELARLVAEELRSYDRVLAVVDQAVRRQFDDFLARLDGPSEVVEAVIDVHESNKGLAVVGELMEGAVRSGIDRRSAVLAMGGGVTGNTAGMVAALLFRGLPLLHLPTTPVAALDSVLSAKQAVNLSHGKNLCGTYLVPSLIACDLAWLETVPRSELVTGLAEMAKNVLAVVPTRADAFLEAVCLYESQPQTSLEVMLDIGISAKEPFLAGDPKEQRGALVFEYGHTVGHAIEFASAGAMRHGEAVAWGMLVAAEVARRVTGLSDSAVREHYRLADILGLEPESLSSLRLDRVLDLVSTDNKRGYLGRVDAGQTQMVLLDELGKPSVQDGLPLVAVGMSDVQTALEAVVCASSSHFRHR